MVVSKDYLRILKYQNVDDIYYKDGARTTGEIIKAYEQKFPTTILSKAKDSREKIIFMLWKIQVTFKNIDSKLSNKMFLNPHGLAYWMYDKLLSNWDIYVKEFGLEFYLANVPSPTLLLEADDNLLSLFNDNFSLQKVYGDATNVEQYVSNFDAQKENSDTLDDEDTKSFIFDLDTCSDNTHNTDIPSAEAHNTSVKNILWVSRHSLFDVQLSQLKELYGENLQLFQWTERLTTVDDIRSFCIKENISVVFAVLPEYMLVALRQCLPPQIKLIRSRSLFVADRLKIVKFKGEKVIDTNLLNLVGLEEVTGCKILTEELI